MIKEKKLKETLPPLLSNSSIIHIPDNKINEYFDDLSKN